MKKILIPEEKISKVYLKNKEASTVASVCATLGVIGLPFGIAALAFELGDPGIGP